MSGDLKSLEPFCEVVAFRLQSGVARNDYQTPVHFLKAMLQHWTVSLLQHIGPDVYGSLCIDPENVRVSITAERLSIVSATT